MISYFIEQSFYATLAALFSFFGGIIIWGLWNFVARIIHLPAVNYWQSCLLAFILSLIALVVSSKEVIY